MKHAMQMMAAAALIGGAHATMAQLAWPQNDPPEAPKTATADGFQWFLGDSSSANVLRTPQAQLQSLVIRSTQPESNVVAAAEENLSIMGRILNKAAAAGEISPMQEAMGIKVVSLGGNTPGNLEIEGYGAIFFLRVNFPLVQPPPGAAAPTNAEPANSTWEETKRELYGTPARAARPRSSSAYDAARVAKLKDSLIGALKNASHLDSESVTVVVCGAEPAMRLFVRPATPGTDISVSEYSGDAANYTVRTGDTLVTIAKTLGVTRAALLAANPGFDADRLKVGAELTVPAVNPPPGTSADMTKQLPGRRGGSGAGSITIATTSRQSRNSDSSVMTLRAEKSAIDAFAKGDLSFEQFRDRVSVLTY